MSKKFGVASVVRRINRGGMGAVDEVVLLDGTHAARKVFDPDPRTFSNPTELAKLRKRFEREVRVQEQLGRIGAMPVLGSDMSAEPPWFVMPLAEKSYADQIIEDRAANKITLEPLADILSGLEQMHELDYVHRDLKPENVLFWAGTWRLSDFGLAASIVGSDTSRFTTLSSWGSPTYMAPEQMVDFRHVKQPADIYSFGCLLHELIDGGQRTPYVVQRTNTEYDYIIRKCTETEPKKRFKSIASLRAVLFDELRRDPGLKRSAVTERWEAELPTIEHWESQRVGEFISHVEQAHPGDELHIISELREEHLDAFVGRAPDEWEALALAYCDWARASFTFDFCDVIGASLRYIFKNEASNVTVKANVATAMATLASDNRRWYCMRLLNPMSDKRITENLAKRIAMEIRANELHADFEHCASDVYGWDRSDYHPAILESLDEKTS